MYLHNQLFQNVFSINNDIIILSIYQYLKSSTVMLLLADPAIPFKALKRFSKTSWLSFLVKINEHPSRLRSSSKHLIDLLLINIPKIIK